MEETDSDSSEIFFDAPDQIPGNNSSISRREIDRPPPIIIPNDHQNDKRIDQKNDPAKTTTTSPPTNKSASNLASTYIS